MRAARFAMAAAMIMLAVAMAGAVISDSDVDAAADASAEHGGKCGTGTGTFADWSVKDKVLTISGTGSVSALTASASAWTSSGWTCTTPSDTTAQSKPSDLFDTVTKVVIETSGTVAGKALNTLAKATEVSFGTSHKTIEEGLFEGNTTITTVDLKNVEVLSKNAFKGCTKVATVSNATTVTDVKESAFEGCTALKTVAFSTATFAAGSFKGCTALETIDVGKTTSLDRTAFEGCTKLTTIKVSSDNTAYCAVGDLVYTKDKATLYMCPNSKTGSITSVESTVRTINLDYADVRYVLDGSLHGNADISFSSVTGAKAIAVVYYKQAIIDGSVSYKFENSYVTLSYKLYKGWTVNTDIAKVTTAEVAYASDTGLSFAVSAGNGYLVDPVGKRTVTKADLVKDTINGWNVKDVKLAPEYGTNDVVKEITSYSCTICGYSSTGSGAAVLGKTLVNYGALCTVDSLEEGDYTGMTSLTITDNMQLKEGTFANNHTLVAVMMPEVEKIPKGTFRYCTELEYVDLGACTEIGDYAFDGCISLTDVRIRSASIELADSAFYNCLSLSVIHGDYDTEIDGYIPMVAFVLCDDDEVEFHYLADSLIVLADGMKSLKCNGVEYQFYKGGMAEVKTEYGSQKIELIPGTPSSKCYVALESQIILDYEGFVVESGAKLDKLPTPSLSGYNFKGWFDESGKQYTSESTVDESVVLIAKWQDDVTKDKTPTYLLMLFGIALVGTAIVLAVSKYR